MGPDHDGRTRDPLGRRIFDGLEGVRRGQVRREVQIALGGPRDQLGERLGPRVGEKPFVGGGVFIRHAPRRRIDGLLERRLLDDRGELLLEIAPPLGLLALRRHSFRDSLTQRPVSISIKTLVLIAAPFEAVVEGLSEFGALGRWHPAFADCRVEGEGAGAIRTCRLAGEIVRDRLDEIAEDGRGYRYTQIEGPIAASSHQGYFWVRRKSDGTAVVEWAAKLKGTAMPEALVQTIMKSLFEAGLAAAKVSLEGRSRS